MELFYPLDEVSNDWYLDWYLEIYPYCGSAWLEKNNPYKQEER